MGEMDSSAVYRTAPGMIFRVTETVEGGLKVEVLQDDAWVPGRIGMVGLRLAPSTKELGADAVRALPRRRRLRRFGLRESPGPQALRRPAARPAQLPPVHAAAVPG